MGPEAGMGAEGNLREGTLQEDETVMEKPHKVTLHQSSPKPLGEDEKTIGGQETGQRET